MKKTMTILAGLLACLAGSIPARAQDQPELQAFQEVAGDHSILFRSKQATRYNLPANGNPYWSGPGFERGDIHFEGNYYSNVPLNIDATTQRVLVQLSGSPFAVALTPEQTPSFTIGEREFVGIGSGDVLPEGYYEVFGEGRERIYKHIAKVLSSSVFNMNGEGIGYFDNNYREDVTRYFAYHQTYYFRDADGKFTRFKGRNALIRQYPGRRQEIRKAIRDAQMYGRNYPFDDFCKAVLKITAR